MTVPPAASRRPKGARAIAAATLALALTGCGGGSSESSGDPVPGASSPDALCRLLSVPLQTMRAKHSSFAQLVAADPEEDLGVGGMIVFAAGPSPSGAGRYGPVLRFLAERSLASERSGGGPTVPMPAVTDAVISSARSLDAALAAGRCR